MLELVNQKIFNELKEKLWGGDITLKVMSNSMAPLINNAEEVVVRRIESPLKQFDIIVFWTGQILIGHYVWHINEVLTSNGERVVVTRSLVAKRDDLPIQEDKILGRIISHEISGIWKLRLLLRNIFRFFIL